MYLINYHKLNLNTFQSLDHQIFISKMDIFCRYIQKTHSIYGHLKLYIFENLFFVKYNFHLFDYDFIFEINFNQILLLKVL